MKRGTRGATPTSPARSSKKTEDRELLSRLTTETRHPATLHIDTLSPLQIVKMMNREDRTVAAAVEAVLQDVARVVEIIVERLSRGGRLFYVGAGTSGRLGVLDAAECPPTFGTSPDLVQGVIAGGAAAMFTSQEGAEDREDDAAQELRKRRLHARDVVVSLSASGRTPFAIGALKYARKIGAAAVAITCNADAAMQKHADILIAPVVGPEVILGSTRMKAGTAQKMILNMISTATMIRLGRVHSNLMVDLQIKSEKLRRRAVRLIQLVTGASERDAVRALRACNGNTRAAIEGILDRRSYSK